jgi:hypothetical protein
MQHKPQRARNNKSVAAAEIAAMAAPPTGNDAAGDAYHLIKRVAEGKVGSKRSNPNVARLITGDSAYRKTLPMCTGLIDYFPDACAAVANVSCIGNMKHNPGEPMHHARGKSMDHADCIARHLTERGGYDIVVVDGTEYRIRHTAALAWRAMALLQQELEDELGLPLPRAARL